MGKRICPIHGMWERTERVTRCPQCQRTTAKAYDRLHRDQDADVFYHSVEWKRMRRRILARDPICQLCRRVPSVIVDHIVPISVGGCRLCEDNLQGVCRSCHNEKTREDEREGRGRKNQGKPPYTAAPPNLSRSSREGGTL